MSMKRKSPNIEAVAFAIRSVVVIDCEVGVHNLYACTVYVDLHAVGFWLPVGQCSCTASIHGWNVALVSELAHVRMQARAPVRI
jgi:hypothetical protein